MTEGYHQARKKLEAEPKRWCVTGAAGFIGSHLVEELLRIGQYVVALDNFATGHERNLEDVRRCVGEDSWSRFTFIRGDIADLAACRSAVGNADYVLHQAALGSVPRSIEEPLLSHRANVDGFLNMLSAAREAGVKRFVYASSSSVYGDEPSLPKVEERIGSPLSPYAATKLIDEIYAAVFHRVYGVSTAGLRYFNVFGPRQDPAGAYAAVIPKWIEQILRGEPCAIHGDGETSRDFCYVENVVRANILAAVAPALEGAPAFNVAVGGRTTLKELYEMIALLVAAETGRESGSKPVYGPFRSGDVRHSLADISRAESKLGYEPGVTARAGLEKTVRWFVANRQLLSSQSSSGQG